tara:strand:+ start:4622 stop:4870 length:249 start_codon:yes stop_codon:yes gene_type:complete
MNLTKQKIEQRLGIKRLALIANINVDFEGGAIEIDAIEGYVNPRFNEVAHIYGVHNFENQTQADYFADLIDWADGLEPGESL